MHATTPFWITSSTLGYVRVIAAIATYCLVAVPNVGAAQEAGAPAERLTIVDMTEAAVNAELDKPCFLMPDDVVFDPAIPSPKDFLGFELGELHIRHHQLVAYLHSVAHLSDRIALEEIGSSHGQRPLLLLTITSARNHGRLDAIRANHRALAYPDTHANVDTKDLPVVINMGYSVHGDESSGANAVPAVVYYLAAAQGEKIESMLDNMVILLDPCLNPDGFDRFAAHANAYRGQKINSDPSHFEHNQPWPGGRVNYYWFDLNRDWLPVQHPESQARIQAYHAWKPNVVLDFHEMGTSSTFFFQPGVPQRTNPLTPKRNVELTRRMAEYHAAALDDLGSLYYTEENFDDFYMGKGSTYPDLHGSVGILFEQASSRGHAQQGPDGVVTFPFTIRNQYTCTMSSLQATYDMRDELLDYQRDFYRQSLQAGEQDPVKAFAFTAAGDMTRLSTFAEILTAHDIRCYWLAEDRMVRGQWLEAGTTLIVPTAQPEYRFLLSLIERRTEFAENIFYDISAWTLPLAFNLDTYDIRQPLRDAELVRFERAEFAPLQVPTDEEVIAVALPWTNYDAPKALYQLLDAKVKVRVAERPFQIQIGETSKQFGYGTLVIPFGIQDLSREEVSAAILAAQPGNVYPIRTGLTPVGIDLGSNQFTTLEKPNVLMPIAGGVSRGEAGEIWHLMDTRIGMPLTMVDESRLDSASLSDYNVIVLPSGRYSSLNDRGTAKLRDWVSDGGTLIAIGSAVNALDGAGLINVDFISSSSIEDNEAADGEPAEEDSDERQKPYASARDEQALALISGAIFQAHVDITHPIGYGYLDSSLPVFRNNRIFMKPSDNPYANAVVYDREPLLGGYVSKENLAVLSQVASVRVVGVGRGRVIAMTDNPNFRAFWYGTNRLFFNSVFFGQLTREP